MPATRNCGSPRSARTLALDEACAHGRIASGNVPADDLYSLALSRSPDGDRDIWAASRVGLVRVHNDRAEVFDRRYGLPSNVVRGVKVWRSPDGFDVLWLATEGGVARTIIGASPWKTATLMGARSSGVFGVLVEPDADGGERLWVASSADGLGLYEHGNWRTFMPANSPLASASLRFVKHASDERGEPALWIGFDSGELQFTRDGQHFESVAVPWKPEQRPGDHRHARAQGSTDTTSNGSPPASQACIGWRDGKTWTSFHPSRIGTAACHRVCAEQIDASGPLLAVGNGHPAA